MEYIIPAIFAGIICGIIIMIIAGKIGVSNARQQSQEILEEAKSKADTTVKQALLDGKQQVYEMKLEAEKQLKEQQDKILQTENKLLRREDSLNFREEGLAAKEKKLNDKNRSVDAKLANISKMEEELQEKIDDQMKVLEQVSQMSQEDAHRELMDKVAKQSEKEIAQYMHEQQEEAENNAAANARNIIATAIHRYSQEEVIERTVSTILMIVLVFSSNISKCPTKLVF